MGSGLTEFGIRELQSSYPVVKDDRARSALPRRGVFARSKLIASFLAGLFAVAILGASVVLVGSAACTRRSDFITSAQNAMGSSGEPEPLHFPGTTHDETSNEPSGPLQSLFSLSSGELWATWNSWRGDAYPLDRVERFLEDGQRVACDPTRLIRHSGTHLRYQSGVQIDPAFRERLIRFEGLVNEVAIEIYGRPPNRLAHFGAYSCRPSRRRSYRLSEHALGNAIDVTGFDFSRAKRGEALALGAPQSLSAAFRVRVAQHWPNDPKSPASALHSRFLHELSSRLSARDDVFRVMIGPSRRDHADHFHFDMSPWRYVSF